METLKQHEIFEIELLEKLKNGFFLSPLVFGGGTMLRLCYELNRYSADLDFWFIKDVDHKEYFEKLKYFLQNSFELTDAEIKHYTLLFEIRDLKYPKRLKIEIRKRISNCDFQEKIAFSNFTTKQVLLNVHTLKQTIKNKIDAALDRKDVRDCFDLEFILRQGGKLEASPEQLMGLQELIMSFTPNDYKVTLGSLLESDLRRYYVQNKFDYLLSKIKNVKL